MEIMNIMKRVVFAVLIGALALTGCAPATTSTPAAAPASTALTKIRLPMGYVANVQYAPFYIAVDKGYFKAAGFDIEFDYRFETDGMKLVGANELPFAVVSGEQVPLAREQGLPVIYVMQWWKKYPIAVVSLTEKNITTPADLVGKSVGLPGFFGASYIGWRGLLYKAGIDEAQIKTQDIGFTQVAALQQGKVDAAVVYINNEPIQLRAAGLNVNVIDVGAVVPMVANGIVTNEQTVKDKPEMVRGFVQALMHGVADAIADPELAFNTSKKFVEGLGSDPAKDDIQRQVLTESIKLWQDGAPGASDPAAWDMTQDVLMSMGLIKAKIDPAQLYTNQFVEAK
jgi:NitT/TauT family transport system substrate-binding protein